MNLRLALRFRAQRRKTGCGSRVQGTAHGAKPTLQVTVQLQVQPEVQPEIQPEVTLNFWRSPPPDIPDDARFMSSAQIYNALCAPPPSPPPHCCIWYI